MRAARIAMIGGKESPYWGLTFTAEEPNVVVNMAKTGSPPSVTMEYSLDGKNWSAFDPDGTTPVTLENVGSFVCFRAGEGGNTAFASSIRAYRRFTLSNRCRSSGSVMSILGEGVTSIADYGLFSLFRTCTFLTSAPSIDAESIGMRGCGYMFYGCTALAQSPEMPATSLGDYCYQYMFYGCTALTQSSELPATTLGTYCYQYMFRGCSSLTQAPELPATTITNYCYSGMFYGCTSLTQATGLSATTLADYCYQNMFYGCSSLTQAPELPARTLADYCYRQMFYNCTALETAPFLPATNTKQYCYNAMFYGCTALIHAPDIIAIDSTSNSYASMFYGCTSMTDCRKFSAQSLAGNCAQSMFYGCSKLSYVAVAATDWGTSFGDPFSNWLSGVSQTGTFKCSRFLGNNDTIERGTNRCPSGWTAENPTEYLYFEAEEPDTVINMSKNGSPSGLNGLEYSTDGLATWASFDYDAGTTPITLQNVGDRVYFSAGAIPNSGSSSTTYGYRKFTTSKKCKCGGRVASILDSSTLRSTATTYYGLYALFDSSLISTPPELGFTSVGEGCFYLMFSKCIHLKSAPSLPAGMLSKNCYYGMFSGCSSLEHAPALPATKLGESCYFGMFRSCTSIVSAPDLPAKVLAKYCYREMFNSCSALAVPPSELPAEDMTEPEPYNCMFRFCTALESSPVIYARTLSTNAMGYMFDGCSSLRYIELKKMTSFQTSNMTNWVKDVSSSGVFICRTELGDNTTITRGTSACPNGWFVCNSAPLTFTAQAANSTISMAKTGAPSVTPLLKTSVDNGATWQTFTPGSTTITLANIGDNVMFYRSGTNTATASSISDYWYFVMTGEVAASGNISSIVSEGDASDYTFANLFYSCAELSSAPELSATTLTANCYYSMFRGCTSLTSAPVLPATTLAESCYTRMFQGCSGLTLAPDLPATTLSDYCYQGMFISCTSLQNPPALPATTLTTSCYQQMFSLCSSLTSAPELTATTLAASCYQQMFNGCSSLKKTPDLPATTASDYEQVYYRMFYACTSLERTGSIAIETANGTSALAEMFRNCSNLKYIELTGMTSWPITTTDWVDGVAANGLFVCLPELGTATTIARGTSACPTGWNVSSKIFRYIAIKMVANRALHESTDLASYRTDYQKYIQASILRFIDESGLSFQFPAGTTVSVYTKYNGERHYTTPALLSNYNSGEMFARLFDGSTSTKYCATIITGAWDSTVALYNYDTGTIMAHGGDSELSDQSYLQEHFGTPGSPPNPAVFVIDLGSEIFSPSVYSRWQFFNANDNGSSWGTGRTWVEGEILVSNDLSNWNRLDVFNDAGIPNTNYSLAYTGSLTTMRNGNLWSDIDLATRDWSTGIIVD